MSEMAIVGAEVWLNNSNYEQGAGDGLYERATNFFDAINWDTLITLASKAHADVSCHLSEKYSLGNFNLVRQIIFADGTLWIVRLRLPGLDGVFAAHETLDTTRAMQVEVATLNYLRIHTSIPVPQVFGHDFNTGNIVGAPYIFMSYIHGTVARKLRTTEQGRAGLFGTVSQDRRFRQQMANIQVQLALHTFDRIGSIYQDGDSFTIGPEVETGLGPFDNSAQYWKALVRHLLKEAEAEAGPEVCESPSFKVPYMFADLMQLCGGYVASGPFSLVNRDFGAHNLLVNDEYEIVGLIDVDGVLAAPKEMVARFPDLTGLQRETPGHVETENPWAMERIRKTAPQLDEYQNMVDYAVTQALAEESNWRKVWHIRDMASLMTSDTGSVLQGLTSFAFHQKFVNDRWMDGYEYLRRKKQNQK